MTSCKSQENAQTKGEEISILNVGSSGWWEFKRSHTNKNCRGFISTQRARGALGKESTVPLKKSFGGEVALATAEKNRWCSCGKGSGAIQLKTSKRESTGEAIVQGFSRQENERGGQGGLRRGRSLWKR